jgi:hypothetical protein
MDPFSYTADGLNVFQYLDGTLQYDIHQDVHGPLLGDPELAISDMAYLMPMPYHLLTELDLPAPTTEPISPTTSSTTSPTSAIVINHPNHSFSTRMRTNKVHQCCWCGKLYARPGLAEGCKNRHKNLRPYRCQKGCGDPNWYVVYFSLRWTVTDIFAQVRGHSPAGKSGAGTIVLWRRKRSLVPSGQ